MPSITPPSPECQTFKLTALILNDDDSVTHLAGAPVDADGNSSSSSVSILLPYSLHLQHIDDYEWCPDGFMTDEIITAQGPKRSGGLQFYTLTTGGGRRVQPIGQGCDMWKTVVESAIGPAGPKGPKGGPGTTETGEKGEEGDFGTKGVKGDPGEEADKGVKGAAGEKGQSGGGGPKGPDGSDGEAGETGSKGAQGASGGAGAKGADGSGGQQGDPGDDGNPGAKGQAGDIGEDIDWNTEQQSIIIGSKKFGPRLFGVCQNGSYEYVYIFASDPE